MDRHGLHHAHRHGMERNPAPFARLSYNEPERMQQVFRKMLRLTAFLSCPALFGLSPRCARVYRNSHHRQMASQCLPHANTLHWRRLCAHILVLFQFCGQSRQKPTFYVEHHGTLRGTVIAFNRNVPLRRASHGHSLRGAQHSLALCVAPFCATPHRP